jgi:hypothetical protein
MICVIKSKLHALLIFSFFDLAVKVKVTLAQATKAQRGSTGINLLFL